MTHLNGDPSRLSLTRLCSGWSGRLAAAGVFLAALAATVPTAGDFGLTWDEPTYRYSQSVSAHWWVQLGRARSWTDVNDLLGPDSLNYYWPYGRFGPNLHPPLAGQLCLLSHAVFKHWVKDAPSRRLASVCEYSLTISMLFGFLARRYGSWVGGVAASALLLMPRVYGDGHIAGTDTPGLMLWATTAVVFWNALHAERGQWWRIMVGVLLGLAFVEKMSTVAVMLPLFAWLAAVHVPRTFNRRSGLADWIDGVTTTAGLLSPLVLASLEIVRLARVLPAPAQTDLFRHRPTAFWSGAILAFPLVIWIVRRALFRVMRGHPVWGVERPALETWAALITFAPIVAWLGNPLWWRETLPRLAHYLMLNTARRGVVPDIPIFYWGQTYFYTLPWHNAWVLHGHHSSRRHPLGCSGRVGIRGGGGTPRSATGVFRSTLGDAASDPDAGDACARWHPAVTPGILLRGRDGGVGNDRLGRLVSPPDPVAQPSVAMRPRDTGARPGGLAACDDSSL